MMRSMSQLALLVVLVGAGCFSTLDDSNRRSADPPEGRRGIADAILVGGDHRDGAVIDTSVFRPPEEPDTFLVSVVLNLPTDSVRPRIVELFMSHSEDLVFAEAIAGEAVNAAGKQLIAQARDARTVRLLVFSSGNVNDIERGELATLRFIQESDGPASIQLLAGKQVFAPAAANVGLVLSQPVMESAAPNGESP